MKKALIKSFLLALPLLSCASAKAQLISGDIFFKGNFMEVGIGANGALGSTSSPPSGFHPNIIPSLGVVADPDKDGWTISEPGRPLYLGDFITPGDPVESWTIAVSGVYGTAKADHIFSGGLTGSNNSYNAAGGIFSSRWKGAFDSIYIVQDAYLNKDGFSLRFNISLKNTSTHDMYNVFYHRGTDPDNEAVQTGNYQTNMKIEQQVSAGSNLGIVSARGLSYNSYFSLNVNDCRAKVYYLNATLSPAEAIDSLYYHLGSALYSAKKGDTLVADVGMGVVFNIGTIKAGETKTLSFGYAFDENIKEPKWSSNGKLYNNKDTVSVCFADSAELKILDTAAGVWSWKSNPNYSDEDANVKKVKAIFSTEVIAYRHRRNECGAIESDTAIIFVTGVFPAKPIINVSGDILALSGYKSYRWYNVASGAALSVKDAYRAKLSGYYYAVVIDSLGCEAYSDTVFIDSAVLSIKNILTEKQNAFYPNPTNGVLHSGQSIPLDITVTDMSGRIVLQKKSITELDLSSFVNGMYFIHYNSEKNNVKGVQKVIKRSSE